MKDGFICDIIVTISTMVMNSASVIQTRAFRHRRFASNDKFGFDFIDALKTLSADGHLAYAA